MKLPIDHSLEEKSHSKQNNTETALWNVILIGQEKWDTSCFVSRLKLIFLQN